jgi:hypothetical protein
MSVSPISRLPKDEQQELLDDLNYLNTAEIKCFCKRQAIPYTIAIETSGGCLKDNENDRKGVILAGSSPLLKTGMVLWEHALRVSCVF